jgi:ABC-type transport system involved in multi-copper enzyme maturation permease subunit
MAELTREAHEPRWWQLILQNPVAMKELRGRMRGRRAFVILSFYLLVMSSFVALVYLAYLSSTGGISTVTARDAGKGIFAAVLVVQGFLVTFIGPSFTAGAVSGERERQTYDLLQTTLLSPRTFVLGKLIAALSYVFLLVFASIPVQSLAFLLGGLSPAELIISQVVMVVAAVVFALWGLFCSASLRSTLASTIATFGGTFFVTLGAPLLAFIFSLLLSPMLAALGQISEAVLIVGGLLLAATNLPATLLLSELILLENNSLFLFSQTTSGGRAVSFLSPWILFLVLYMIAAVLLFWACVRRVAQISET